MSATAPTQNALRVLKLRVAAVIYPILLGLSSCALEAGIGVEVLSRT